MEAINQMPQILKEQVEDYIYTPKDRGICACMEGWMYANFFFLENRFERGERYKNIYMGQHLF